MTSACFREKRWVVVVVIFAAGCGASAGGSDARDADAGLGAGPDAADVSRVEVGPDGDAASTMDAGVTADAGDVSAREAGPDADAGATVDAVGSGGTTDAADVSLAEVGSDSDARVDLALDRGADAGGDVGEAGQDVSEAGHAGSPDGSSADSGADASPPVPLPVYLGTVANVMMGSTRPVVAIASDGSVFFAGSFGVQVDFDPGPSVDSRTPQGINDVFLTKLNADGSYAWTLTFGGAQSQTFPGALAITDTDIVIAGAYTAAVDFDPGAGVQMTVAGDTGEYDGFVLDLKRNGTFSWVSPFRGASECFGVALAIGADSSIYVGGAYDDACDFDPGPGTDLRAPAILHNNAFIEKLAGSDGHELWTQTYDPNCQGYVNAISLSPTGDLWVTGAISNECAFGGLASPTSTADQSALIESFGPDGTAKSLETIASVNSDALAIAGDGTIYVSGSAGGVSPIDFDPGAGSALETVSVDGNNPTGFVVELGSDGAYRSVTTMPGTYVRAVTTIADGGALAVGQASPNVPNQQTAFVISKLAPGLTTSWALPFPGLGADVEAIAARGSVFVIAGISDELFDVNPGPAVENVSPNTTFLSRYSF